MIQTKAILEIKLNYHDNPATPEEIAGAVRAALAEAGILAEVRGVNAKVWD